MSTGVPMRGRGPAGRLAVRRGGRNRGGAPGRGGAMSRGAARGGVVRGEMLPKFYFSFKMSIKLKYHKWGN